MTVTATAFTHKDVKGKELMYLKISNGQQDILVNVGKKTYDGVLGLQKNEPQKPKGGKEK